MSIDLESHYQAVTAYLTESLPDGSITWCRASSVDELAVSLGGELQSAAPRSLFSADEEAQPEISRSGHGRTLVIGELGPWLVVLEPAGWIAVDALPRLSGAGEAVSLVIGDTLRHYHLHYSRDGRQVCRFRWGAQPDGDASSLEPLLSGLSLTSGLPSLDEIAELPSFAAWKTHALILTERLTGVRLTVDWLNREHRRYFCRPSDSDVGQ
ncbi:DUF6461 domain-containing protein [Nonomuraea sp. NBC_00507]|uniref:DUF6461 domain-containing protein n=1 Tax=Nonomuraea sp. NBC_00507 TaxID=2976002 RepID=UPI002E18B512